MCRMPARTGSLARGYGIARVNHRRAGPARSRQRAPYASACSRAPRRLGPARVRTEPRRRPWWAWIPALAALALLFVVAGLWRSNIRAKDELAELTNRNQDQSIQLAQARENLRLLTSSDAVRVSLNPQNASKHPTGTAIFSPSQKRMLFMASNLAPTPPGKAYELWGQIPTAEGAPIPAGMFKPDEHGNAVMMDHPMPPDVEAKAFAVTWKTKQAPTSRPRRF